MQKDGLREYTLSEDDVWKYYYRRVAISCPSCIYYVVAEVANDEDTSWDCEYCGAKCVCTTIEDDFDA